MTTATAKCVLLVATTSADHTTRSVQKTAV